MKKQLDRDTKADQLFEQSQRSSGQSVQGGDVSEYENALVAIYVDSYTDGTTDFTVQESDDDSTYTDASDTVSGSEPSIDGSGKTGWHYMYYTGNHPYLGLKSTISGATDGCTWSAHVVKTDKREAPIGSNV